MIKKLAKPILLLLLFLAVSATPVCRLKKSENVTRLSSIEVDFESGGNTLRGTLYIPDIKEKFPAVVILAGSDRSSRGPLRIRLAKSFAKKGIGALVYDSPGAGLSEGNAILQTINERINEALSAMKYLNSFKGVKKNATGLFGGSEGAVIALLSAAISKEVSFVVATSGAAGISEMEIMSHSAKKRGEKLKLSFSEIKKAEMFKQLSFMLLSGIIPEKTGNKTIEECKKMGGTWSELALIIRLRASEKFSENIERIFSGYKKTVEKFSKKTWIRAADPTNRLNMVRFMDADIFLKILKSGRYSKPGADDIEMLSKIRCPVLAIWGADDLFLPPELSKNKLEKVFAHSGHGDHSLKIFPGASHYLTTGGINSPFIKGYPEIVISWIKKKFTTKKH